jgi:hypothetical protein
MNHVQIFESYRGDRIKKSYQNSILYKFEETKIKLKNQENEILDLINEYIGMNNEYFTKKYNYYSKYNKMKGYIFTIDINNKPGLKLYQESIICDLIYDDIEKLLKFLEDPDLYRNAKKYNL